MSVKSLIHTFSAGKIIPKYYIIVPKYSKITRHLVTATTFSVILLILFLISQAWDEPKGTQSTVLLILLIAFFIFVPGYLIGKLLSNYSILGEIQFKQDHLIIQQKKESRVINYSEILRINHIGHLRDPRNGGNIVRFMTYKVKFFLSTKENITFLLKSEMHFSREDDSEFRANPPFLLDVFEAINPRYGVIPDSRI